MTTALVSESPKVRGLRMLQARGLPVPPFAAIHRSDEIAPAIAQLSPAPAGFSVRSASIAEDTESSSMAGRFESFNGLCADDVPDIARRILDAAGAAIVQHTFPSWLGGVAFVESETSIVVEAMYGSCRNIVDGAVAPYRSRWRGEAWTHDHASADTDCAVFACAAECFAGAAHEPGVRLHPRATPFIEHPRLLLPPVTREWNIYGYRPPSPPSWYEERVLVPLRRARLTGMDIEWGCDADGSLMFFQARPITARLPSPVLRSEGTLAGIGASAGTHRGVIGEDVLMLNQISDVPYEQLVQARAVLAATGGILSHVAILCRELRIPCVTGLGELLDAGTRVEVDGTTGEVRVLESAATRAAALLREGKLVVIPTDTVYCLVADARSDAAVEALFAAKERPRTSPIIAAAASFDEAAQLVVMNPSAARLAEAHWPGALTLVLPTRGICAAAMSGGRRTLAVRVSPHPFVQELLAAFGGPIAMTSANRSGRPAATTAAQARAELGGRVALIVDDGPSPIGIPSTVLDVTDEAHPIVVREGPVRW